MVDVGNFRCYFSVFSFAKFVFGKWPHMYEVCLRKGFLDTCGVCLRKDRLDTKKTHRKDRLDTKKTHRKDRFDTKKTHRKDRLDTKKTHRKDRFDTKKTHRKDTEGIRTYVLRTYVMYRDDHTRHVCAYNL